MANQPKRNNETKRNMSRIMQTRTFVLMLVLGVGVFLLVFAKLFELQILRHEELQGKALSQQTQSTEISATRGTIYDRGGNILAISATAETVFLSPLELAEELAKEDTTWTADFLAENLGRLLDINTESILQKMERTYSQYEVIKLRAEESVANEVRKFLTENNIHGVYMVTDAKRYYPYSSLASHIVGFVGTDNTGLYGLEARCEEELAGETGLVVTANEMLYSYEQYYGAENGNDLVLTIDTTVQYYLESALAEMASKYEAAEGATGIVMNVNTGAILGMASYPDYDLNNFSEIRDDRLQAAVDSGSASLGDMQLRQWRNKTLNDTYEPGSTFKILTLAAALEEGVITMNTTYDCPGYIKVSGETIKCTATHRHQSLQQTAANSCNPAFISYGLKLGTEKFYEYMDAFGLMSGSGVDLDGEATGIFISPENFTQLDLACYAFGQNFNVTPIALIAAQAACVNGGYLHTPYVVEQVLGDDGTVLYQHDTTPIRQVVSEETSEKVRQCLEYVVADGTGRNGQVTGYRIGGKTGTADKGQTGEVVVSFACFAPADDPEIIMLLTLDTPSRNTGTYPSGGAMTAPMASSIMSEILPYLGIEPSYSAEELLGADTSVPNVVGLSVSEAKNRLRNKGFAYKVVGDGSEVTDQTPVGSAVIPGKSTVVLYAGEEKPDSKCTVPALVGKTPAEANVAATNAGILLRFTGTTASASGSIRVLSQSVEVGTKVEAGTVISVQLGDTAVID